MTKRTENQINKILGELEILRGYIEKTCEKYSPELDYCLLQVDNVKLSLENLLAVEVK